MLFFKKYFSFITVLLILTIGGFLRFYQLDQIPRGVHTDEVIQGYNAYTLLTYGKTETGNTQGIYSVLTAIPISLFGLSIYSTRFISALAGSLSILVIYLFARQITKESTQFPIINNQAFALLSALLFAITPWSIHFSRAACQQNLLLFYSLFLIYLVFKLLKNSTLKITISLIIIASISYVTAITSISYTPGDLEILKNQTRVDQPVKTIFAYLSHFSPEYLFFSKDILKRHGVGESGLLLIPQLFFLPIGIMLFTHRYTKQALFLISWLLLAPLPSLFSTYQPNAPQSMLMLPPFIFFSAYGITSTIQKLQTLSTLKKSPAYLSWQLTFFAILLVSSLSYFLLSYIHIYYKHYALITSYEWNEHHTRLAQLITVDDQSHSNIRIETQPEEFIHYLKFFNASSIKPRDFADYHLVSSLDNQAIQPGDLVAFPGWKGAPDGLQDVKEVKMSNQITGYKVGVWTNSN